MTLPQLRLSKGEQVWFGDRPMVVLRILGRTIQFEDPASGAIENRSTADLLEEFQKGSLRLRGRSTGIQHARDLGAESEEDQREAVRRLKYVQAALAAEDRSDASLGEAIAKVACEASDQSPSSTRTLRRWIARYLASGGDVRSLVPLTRLKGNRERRYAPEIEELLDRAIDERYLNDGQDTGVSTHERFLWLVDQHNRAHPRIPLSPTSQRTTHRKLKKLDPYLVALRREGKWTADHKYKPTFQREREDRPLECVEIDHTTWNCVLVDDKTLLPVGRPTLTVALDRCTAMPWGIQISYEVPSYLSVMLTLRNGILPKGYVKTEFPSVLGDWPCYGVPEKLSSDNGLEFRGTSIETACYQLRIDPVELPKRMPNLKGAVERYFRTAKLKLGGPLPGKTFRPHKKPDDYDPSESSILSLSDMSEILHRWLIDIYPNEFHRGINDIPREKWNALASQFQPRLPDHISDLDILLAADGKTHKISRVGIEIFGLRYNSDELANIRLHKGNFVNVRYDPSNIGQLWVEVPGEARFITVPGPTQYAWGLSLWQHRAIKREIGKKARRATTRELIAAKEGLRERVAEIMEDRRPRTGASRGMRFLSAPTLALPSPKPTTEAPIVLNDAALKADEDGDDLLAKAAARGWKVDGWSMNKD